jgi:DNA polymerase-1
MEMLADELAELEVEQKALAVEAATKRMTLRGIRIDEAELDRIIAVLAAGRTEAERRRRLMLLNVKAAIIDGRIHAAYKANGARSGRYTCTKPNLQNFPRDYRRVFLGDEGEDLHGVDYCQMELRVMAALAGDTRLLDCCATGDLYQTMADEIGITRQEAKVLAVGVPYGLTAFGVGAQLGMTEEEGQHIITRYQERFPRLFEFVAAMKGAFSATGRARTAIEGRVVTLPIAKDDPDDFRAHLAAAKMANRLFAAYIQGTAADVIKSVMVELDKAGIKVVMQLHDEFVVSSADPAVADQVKSIMEGVHPGLHLAAKASKWSLKYPAAE